MICAVLLRNDAYLLLFDINVINLQKVQDYGTSFNDGEDGFATQKFF